MNSPFTNIHIHVFTSECAPPNFLRVRTFKGLKWFAKPIKKWLEKPKVRKRIWRWDKRLKYLSRNRRTRLNKAVSFLSVGSKSNQLEVFRVSLKVAKSYNGYPRVVAHTLDMDFMDTNSLPIIPYATQLHEVLEIKKYYPDNFFPFISVDPRSRSGQNLVNWIDYYFTHGVKSNLSDEIISFGAGIKLYPAHGFFPFDPGLDELYAYAEKNKIPLMFHCTRVGSQYIGRAIEQLIPEKPEMLMPTEQSPDFQKAQKAQGEIYSRIYRYYQKKKWIKNNKHGVNDFACDLFSHPQNYIPLMCKYPDLKICLAHMGGDEEIKFMNATNLQDTKAPKTLKKIWDVDGHNWAVLIKNLMKDYKNLYADISSTISELDEKQVLQNIRLWLNETDNINQNTLGDRILFGTDFFMTEMQHDEYELYQFMQSKLGNWFNKMAQSNANNYFN
ncbi:MAG: amidohydrolase family protein [Salinivirgaceae bacterium]|nr:amidohydrolase family protein [Salinivirgaceae bacterium]